MAEREHVDRPEQPVPPAGEPVHLPGPSYQPVLTGFGISLAVCGIVITPALVVVGLLITIPAIVSWVRDTREEISELPLEH